MQMSNPSDKRPYALRSGDKKLLSPLQSLIKRQQKSRNIDLEVYDITENLNSEESESETDKTIFDPTQVDAFLEELDNPEILYNQQNFKDLVEPEIINSFQMATLGQNQVISLKDAINCVEKFEGESDKLLDFAKQCEDAKDMLPAAAEEQITKLIQKSRLSQTVKDAISGKTYTTIKDLIKEIEKIYTSSKTEWQLQGELGRMYQKDKELVIEFVNRLRKKGVEIVETYIAKNSDLNDDQIREYKKGVEEIITQCFSQGLKAEIEQRMPTYDNIQTAVDKAIEIERKLHARKYLRKDINNERQNQEKKENKAVKHVKVNDKQKDNKFDKNFQNNDQNNSRNKIKNRNKLDTSNLICHKCGGNGHFAKECRITLKCQICNKNNHVASKCWQHYTDPNRNKTNYTNRNSSTQNRREIGYCSYCKRNGHNIDECFRLKAEKFDEGNAHTSHPSGAGRDKKLMRPVTSVLQVESDSDSQ